MRRVTGLLLGTGVVSLVAGPSFLEWGWRIPFLLSAVLILVGLYVRLSVVESPAFSQVLKVGRRRTPTGRGVIDIGGHLAHRPG